MASDGAGQGCKPISRTPPFLVGLEAEFSILCRRIAEMLRPDL
jgi:hypothetical protein